MQKIAITGNIASGKSTVENIIKDYGYNVYDTDKIAHEILNNSTEIKKHFGTTDRKEIAKIVFNDSKKLKELESIIHPQVKLELEKIFSNTQNIVFVSVPQLFETGFNSMFDKIIFVSADTGIRMQRLMKRNNLTKEEALKRIQAQEFEEEKIKKSDFIIINNNDITELKPQVKNILKQLIPVR